MVGGGWEAMEREDQMFNFQHQCSWSQEYIADERDKMCRDFQQSWSALALTCWGEKQQLKNNKLGCKYKFLIWDSGYLYLQNE